MRSTVQPMPSSPFSERTVGVSSFSSPTAQECPRRLGRALSNLQRCSTGIVEGSALRAKHLFYAGTKEQRATDINAFIVSKQIDLILSCIGGYGSIQLLDLIDYDNPKIGQKSFLGYSDFSMILNAVHSQSGIETYLGPALLPSFGEVGGLDDYSSSYLDKALSGRAYLLDDSDWFSDEILKWDHDDDRPRERTRNNGRRVLRNGSASGKLVGGNLDSFCRIIGTDFCPHGDSLILLIEEFERIPLYLFERNIYQIRHSKIWNSISGVLVGRFSRKVHSEVNAMSDSIILDCFSDLSVPIISGLDFGHTDPIATLPIGRSCEIRDGLVSVCARV